MNDIVRRQSGDGPMEVYDATGRLTSGVEFNIGERGAFAADLLLASLTETPYTPTIDGIRYEVPVTNCYMGEGAIEGGEASTPDTVDEARIALAEFLAADVPGTKRLGLRAYKTRYGRLLDELTPTRRSERLYRPVFDEAFVEASRRAGIDIPSPRVGELIILGAPKRLLALTLESRSIAALSAREQKLKAITEAGRQIAVFSFQRLSNSPEKQYLAQNVRSLDFNRGGHAPGSTIARQIEDRVIKLRTRSTRA